MSSDIHRCGWWGFRVILSVELTQFQKSEFVILLFVSGVALFSLTICNFYKQNLIEITYFYLKKKPNLQGFVITPDLQYLKMNVKPWCQLLKNHSETRNRGSDSAAAPQHEWFFCFSSSLWRLIFNQIKLCEKEQQSWALSHLALSKN